MIITLPSRLWHSGKQWIKRLDRVDITKSDGYAFAGAFVQFGATVEITSETYYLVFGQDASRSGHVSQQVVKLYRADTAGITEAGKWDVGTTPGWALRCRDQIAEIVNGPAPVEDALRAGRYFTWHRTGGVCIIRKIHPLGHQCHGKVSVSELNVETGELYGGGLVDVSEITGPHDPATAAELVGALNLCRGGKASFPYGGSLIKNVSDCWVIAGGPMDPGAA